MTIWLIENKATGKIPCVTFETERAARRYIGGWGDNWSTVMTHPYSEDEVNEIVDRNEG